MVGGDDRRGTTLLAVTTVVALVAGGVWWTASAPEPDVVTGVLPDGWPAMADGRWARDGSRGGPDRPVPPADVVPVPPDQAYGSALVLVDPAGGDTVVRRAPTSVPVPGSFSPPVDALLPAHPGTRYQDARRLAGGGSTRWSAAVDAGRPHVLRYVCLGGGEILIEISGVNDGQPIAAACRTPVGSIGFTAPGPVVSVSVRRPAPSAADVGVQLVAQP